MRCATPSKLKGTTTAVAACTWLAVCAYLYAWWPGLAAALDVHLPRTAFLALGLAAPVGLRLKDRCMLPSTAVIVDLLVAAPPLAAIVLFLYPFLAPVE